MRPKISFPFGTLNKNLLPPCATVALILSMPTGSAIAAPAMDSAHKQGANKQTLTGHYSCKYDNVADNLDVLQLGKGQIKFDLVAVLKAGQEVRNGEVQGVASLKGDTATYKQDDCTVTIKFAGNKAQVKVGNADACGFGAFVTADGSYQKVNARRAKIRFLGCPTVHYPSR